MDNMKRNPDLSFRMNEQFVVFRDSD